MKISIAVVFTLMTLGNVFASGLSENALNTLLNSKTELVGDVHAVETVKSIYEGAISSNAKIHNECEIINKKEAKCILWLTFSPLGETALEYFVILPGNQLKSQIVKVYRGD